MRCAANCCRYAGGYDALLLLLHCRLNAGARACLFANLFLRFTAACLADAAWPLTQPAALAVSVRRAAALLLKAAAAAASGKLPPRIACAFTAARRRMLPLTLPSADAILDLVFFDYLLPAVESSRLSAVGAGKLHSRVRFIIARLNVNVDWRWTCMHDLARLRLLLACDSELLPGESCVARLQANFVC